MVPVRALFCHQCSISVTLFRASPPSPLSVFESISGKASPFLPKWLQYTFFTPEELTKVIRLMCVLSRGRGQADNSDPICNVKLWGEKVGVREQHKFTLTLATQTHIEAYFPALVSSVVTL